LKDFDSIKGKTFTVLGLTYKQDVDDIRESPALVIIDMIQELGGIVKAYDPCLIKDTLEQPFLTDNLDEALSSSDGILLLVNHQKFLDLKPEDLSKGLSNKYIFDARNVINKDEWESEGFVVRILGDGKDD
jgi:UDP-N-acetyl-D-mannosaminuronic acid dehydrogenase